MPTLSIYMIPFHGTSGFPLSLLAQTLFLLISMHENIMELSDQNVTYFNLRHIRIMEMCNVNWNLVLKSVVLWLQNHLKITHTRTANRKFG